MKFVHRLTLFLKTGLSLNHVLGPEAERKNRQKMESNEQAGMTRNRHSRPSSPGNCEEGKDKCWGSGSNPVEVAFELRLEKLGALGRYRNEDCFPGKGRQPSRRPEVPPKGDPECPHISSFSLLSSKLLG